MNSPYQPPSTYSPVVRRFPTGVSSPLLAATSTELAREVVHLAQVQMQFGLAMIAAGRVTLQPEGESAMTSSRGRDTRYRVGLAKLLTSNEGLLLAFASSADQSSEQVRLAQRYVNGDPLGSLILGSNSLRKFMHSARRLVISAGEELGDSTLERYSLGQFHQLAAGIARKAGLRVQGPVNAVAPVMAAIAGGVYGIPRNFTRLPDATMPPYDPAITARARSGDATHNDHAHDHLFPALSVAAASTDPEVVAARRAFNFACTETDRVIDYAIPAGAMRDYPEDWVKETRRGLGLPEQGLELDSLELGLPRVLDL